MGKEAIHFIHYLVHKNIQLLYLQLGLKSVCRQLGIHVCIIGPRLRGKFFVSELKHWRDLHLQPEPILLLNHPAS